jgi:hypothetical protein
VISVLGNKHYNDLLENPFVRKYMAQSVYSFTILHRGLHILVFINYIKTVLSNIPRWNSHIYLKEHVEIFLRVHGQKNPTNTCMYYMYVLLRGPPWPIGSNHCPSLLWVGIPLGTLDPFMWGNYPPRWFYSGACWYMKQCTKRHMRYSASMQ